VSIKLLYFFDKKFIWGEEKKKHKGLFPKKKTGGG
jgi:hypothetical protein